MKKVISKILARFGFGIHRLTNETSDKVHDEGSFLNGKVDSPFDSVPFAGESLKYFVTRYDFNTVLDIGSGEGKHSDVLSSLGKSVTSIDFGNSIYYEKRKDNHTCITADYYNYNFKKPFDAIWASHVLEHQPNPNMFLKKIFQDLKEDGVLAITVPPLKDDIVGGHVTLWNAGILLYQLVMAGFNCKNASVKSYGYNISVIVKKNSIESYPELSFDSGDIAKMSNFFPDGLNEPFDGNIRILNWE